MDVNEMIGNIKTSVDSIKETNSRLDESIKEINSSAEEGKAASKDALAKATKLTEELQSHGDRLHEIEQKMVDGLKAGNEVPKSLGAEIVAAQGYKDFAAGITGKARFEVQANTITGQSGSPTENDETLVAPQRRAGIIEGARRRLTVRDALPNAPTTSNAIDYVKENAWTNNARETNEGVTKPESALTFELQTANVRTIAHFIKASKQILDDAPALAGYIDSKMAYGVNYRIDSQLLNGDGTTQTIEGLLASGNYTAYNPGSNDTALDSINKGKYLVENSDFAATAIMLNPTTWGSIERAKNDQADYLIGNPNGTSITPFLWGLPVVLSNAFPQNYFHVSAIELLATVYNRQGTTVEMFEQDSDNVQKNLVTIRAEARLALAVEQPACAQYGLLVAA